MEIGDDVWLGVNVTVLKGVNIGDGALVGAGSLVTKSIPPHVIAAGVPARVIRVIETEDVAQGLDHLNYKKNELSPIMNVTKW